jgi:hypothetical protein
MNQIFGIGIPTINQAEALESALKLYVDDFPNTMIYILDNGLQDLRFNNSKVEIIKNYDPFPISKSWNWLAKKIYAHSDNALILNDDIYLGKSEEKIVELLKKPADLYCAEHQYDCFSAFILPKKTMVECGGFDEEYTGCYYEDSDYLRTLTVAFDKKIVYSSSLNADYFRRNSSVTKNPELAKGRHINERRYITKWGGAINAETYKTPFNR